MIRLEQVTKRYGNSLAVSDLTFEVNRGEVCVLIGPSGCGKTTTLRMINRLTEATSGRIFVDGKDNATIKPEKLRLSIGYAIQSVGLFPHMTVAENIAVVPKLLHWSRERTSRRTSELLALMGLNPAIIAGKYPHQLSGGEAQRIGVARALAADPPILLMDEPFGAVDPLNRESLQIQFQRVQRQLKKTVIMVTHDLNEAIKLADRIAIMESGRLVQYDTPETILSRPKNKFVHDFVGADRALKQLSRISLEKFIKRSPSVVISASKEDVLNACSTCRWVWVVDRDGRLRGWVDRDVLVKAASLEEATVNASSNEIAVISSASLREALSRMLSQGLRSVPVVDENDRLVGEVTLADIETATSERMENHVA